MEVKRAVNRSAASIFDATESQCLTSLGKVNKPPNRVKLDICVI